MPRPWPLRPGPFLTAPSPRPPGDIACHTPSRAPSPCRPWPWLWAPPHCWRAAPAHHAPRPPPSPPPPHPRPATPATLKNCTTLAQSLALPDTRITSAEMVAEGPITLQGNTTQAPAHCLVKGKMKERTGPVDGASYAIGFEIRMPVNWNGRFLHQANGGLDGSVVTALGAVSGAAPVAPGLVQGFAVLSSDAGHGAPTPFFGLDPQARRDYGYQAVGTLTPMAKDLIKGAYGKGPDRSYIAGCSNGGRHAMVAASRYADQYDGGPAGNPGFTHGQVNDVQACQAAFNLQRDVPTCTAASNANPARDGSCISAEQKNVL